MTSCGAYDQALYEAEQTQVNAALALRGYRISYNQERSDPTVSANSLAYFRQDVERAELAYERSKTRTDAAIDAAEAALYAK